MGSMRYEFREVESCNMCGVASSSFKVLGRRLNRSQGYRPIQKIGIATTICQCARCSLIFANPLPVPESLDDHYGVPPESYWRPTYFEVSPEYFGAQIDRYRSVSKASGKQKVLDIGAGVGKAMTALSRAGFEVDGIEPSRPFYERAVQKMGIDPTRITNVPLEEASYPEGTYDWVTFGAVLEHLYDPAGALDRVGRWLKPGGLIHAEVPSSRWLTSKISKLIYRLQGLDYVGHISPMHPPFHLYEFGLESFRCFAERSGFSIAFHRFMVCSTYLPSVLDPIVKPLMARTDTGMQLEMWLRKEPARS